MADEFTPTTEQVREAASLNGAVAVEPDAFNRWLAAHDREVAARAWDEGREAGRINEHEHRPRHRVSNPYREEVDRG